MGVAALADLVLPRTCAGCGLPGRLLCRPCASLLARPRLATPRRVPWGFPPTVAAGAYAGPVRPTVIAFKERGRAELARPLGTALALAVTALSRAVPERRGPLLLVPVPSSRAALRTRGRDHVRELTRHAVAELRAAGLPAAEAPAAAPAGARAGLVGPVGGPAARQPGGDVPPRPRPGGPGRGALLVLVDDVVTSGATLTEAAGVLAGAAHLGALPVVAAVVAATPGPPERCSRARPAGRPGRNRNGRWQRRHRLSGDGLRD